MGDVAIIIFPLGALWIGAWVLVSIFRADAQTRSEAIRAIRDLSIQEAKEEQVSEE